MHLQSCRTSKAQSAHLAAERAREGAQLIKITGCVARVMIPRSRVTSRSLYMLVSRILAPSLAFAVSIMLTFISTCPRCHASLFTCFLFFFFLFSCLSRARRSVCQRCISRSITSSFDLYAFLLCSLGVFALRRFLFCWCLCVVSSCSSDFVFLMFLLG